MLPWKLFLYVFVNFGIGSQRKPLWGFRVCFGLGLVSPSLCFLYLWNGVIVFGKQRRCGYCNNKYSRTNLEQNYFLGRIWIILRKGGENTLNSCSSVKDCVLAAWNLGERTKKLPDFSNGALTGQQRRSTRGSFGLQPSSGTPRRSQRCPGVCPARCAGVCTEYITCVGETRCFQEVLEVRM